MENKTTTDKVEEGLIVNLPGLIEIFGGALYNEFGAIVREMIQNGHDSIVKRCLNNYDTKNTLNANRIDIIYKEKKGELIIVDTGVGMDKTDIARELNNFAKSSKRDLQKESNDTSVNEGYQIIGEYGVGFLSSMAASDHVTVISKKVNGGCSKWNYVKGSDKAAIETITEIDFDKEINDYKISSKDASTIVVCKISPDIINDYYIDEELIENSVTKYANILPIPIFFNHKKVSKDYLAWADPFHAKIEDWRYVVKDLTDEYPLLVIPIYSPPNELDLQGVLWIPQRCTIKGCSYIDIYVKRMFVMRDENVLLPEWARFIMGMINSNQIRRIVSGNTIIDDNYRESVKKFIKTSIINAFKDLRNLSEEDYWKIVGPHDDIIKESAIDNEEFMDCVWDKLRLKVRQKRLTLPEYMSLLERKTKSKNVIYYYEKPSQEFSANLVSDSTGLPVLSLCDGTNNLFVSKICKIQSYEMLSFQALANDLFIRPENFNDFKDLISACAENNISAEIRRYEPSHIPAVLIEDVTMLERREELLQDLKEIGQYGERRFVEDLEKLFAKERAANRGVSFYLNSDNELINSLLSAPYETKVAICLALYHISYMSAMPELKKNEVQFIYTSISSVLMTLLKESTFSEDNTLQNVKTENINIEKNDKPTRVLMLTPYSNANENVELAVKEVFEAEPYFFEVVLARDIMYESKLLENIVAHIDIADAFVADITDLNPNVMMELGATLIKNDGKPVFSLRGRNALGNVPVDLSSELYISYGSAQDSVSSISDEIRSNIERNGKPFHREIIKLLSTRSKRALNQSLLYNLRRTKLNKQEIGQILSSFRTIEEFINTTDENIASLIKMEEWEITSIKNELKDRILREK